MGDRQMKHWCIDAKPVLLVMLSPQYRLQRKLFTLSSPIHGHSGTATQPHSSFPRDCAGVAALVLPCHLCSGSREMVPDGLPRSRHSGSISEKGLAVRTCACTSVRGKWV